MLEFLNLILVCCQSKDTRCINCSFLRRVGHYRFQFTKICFECGSGLSSRIQLDTFWTPFGHQNSTLQRVTRLIENSKNDAFVKKCIRNSSKSTPFWPYKHLKFPLKIQSLQNKNLMRPYTICLCSILLCSYKRIMSFSVLLSNPRQTRLFKLTSF